MLRAGWALAVAAALAVRLWNVVEGPVLMGYDAWGHLAYVLFLDLYHALPWPDQGWSLFHPPLHYALGFGLAQLGSSTALLWGLSLIGSTASLGVAALAAWVTKAASPDSPWMALLAFCAVAFLPVHLYVSPMIGNELTACFLSAAGIALWIANERKSTPTLGGDALAGLIFGLALLTKASAAAPLAGLLLALVVRALSSGSWRRAGARGLVLAGVALLVASPFYARSVNEYGTPLRMGRDNPLEGQFEANQPPGSRTWRDFVSLSPQLLSVPDPMAPHLIHSVWGSAYVHAWVDARDSWLRSKKTWRRQILPARRAMMLLGLVPSLLALAGAALAVRDVMRGQRSAVYLPLLTCSVVALATFALFAARVPTFAAVKASYLLGLSLPFGAFLARSCEGLAGGRNRWLFWLPVGLLGCALLTSGVVHSSRAVLPWFGTSHLLGTLQLHYGEYDAAREFFDNKIKKAIQRRQDWKVWSANLASIELAAGNFARARSLLEQSMSDDVSALHWNELGVATALAGDTRRAIKHLDTAIEGGGGAAALVNRGAVLAARGKLAAAERDLRDALTIEPDLPLLWHDLAEVLTLAGRSSEAADAASRATRAAQHPPRGHAYGLGDNLGHLPVKEMGRRWMLRLEGPRLELARPGIWVP